MKFAKLVKFGGELVEAADVEYEDYYGGFRCPECNEAVFLRKDYSRKGLSIRAAFVHHRALKGVSACELRIGAYSSEYVLQQAAKARNQRLNKLRTTIWNHVISSEVGNFTHWRKIVKLIENSPVHNTLAKLAEVSTQDNLENISLFFDLFSEYFLKFSLDIPRELQTQIEEFVVAHKKDWKHHSKLSKEALEFFIRSPQFKYLRKRLFCLLVYPKSFKQLHPRFQQGDFDSLEWADAFNKSMALGLSMTFLLIDWVKVYNLGD